MGIAPVGFTVQYSSETKKTVLNDFGVNLEEINDPAFDGISILVKPEEADQLKYFIAYEWTLFTSADIKKSVNGDMPAEAGVEVIYSKLECGADAQVPEIGLVE